MDDYIKARPITLELSQTVCLDKEIYFIHKV